jgi:TonB family protein
MHLTLVESDRSFFRTAECAFASMLLHAGIMWFTVGVTDLGHLLPASEREAKALFLLPPDRIDVASGQTEIFQLGRPGGYLDGGLELTAPGSEGQFGGRSYGRHRSGQRSRVQGEVPFGRPAFLSDSAFSVLEVDETVERFEESAAPVYPSELAARGTEGQVQATYVVDATGRVDTTTIRVLHSDHPRFTESVRTALGAMRFRPARKGGKTVRQLVEQRFNFRIAPGSQVTKQIS